MEFSWIPHSVVEEAVLVQAYPCLILIRSMQPAPRSDGSHLQHISAAKPVGSWSPWQQDRATSVLNPATWVAFLASHSSFLGSMSSAQWRVAATRRTFGVGGRLLRSGTSDGSFLTFSASSSVATTESFGSSPAATCASSSRTTRSRTSWTGSPFSCRRERIRASGRLIPNIMFLTTAFACCSVRFGCLVSTSRSSRSTVLVLGVVPASPAPPSPTSAPSSDRASTEGAPPGAPRTEDCPASAVSGCCARLGRGSRFRRAWLDTLHERNEAGERLLLGPVAAAVDRNPLHRFDSVAHVNPVVVAGRCGTSRLV
uniref:Uncharacterized protein n=1 Tax=Sorangium cellulosum So0157-2 TaxID=1254432 RepID=A0A0G2YF09_SORCE|nr:hypothetical protein [Sorangium cellulosum So0157-2]